MSDIDNRLEEIRERYEYAKCIMAGVSMRYPYGDMEFLLRHLAAWRQSVEEQKSLYPTEVFPADGSSQDCRSAAMARLTCDLIIARHAELMKVEAGNGNS